MAMRNPAWPLASGLLVSVLLAQGIDSAAPPDPGTTDDGGGCASSGGASCSDPYTVEPASVTDETTEDAVLIQLARSSHKTDGRPALVTFFSTECKPYFHWQTATLYASWKEAGVPGQLVRLLACPADQREEKDPFSSVGWDMSTHAHEPVGGAYPPLNKPFGIQSWLTREGSELPDDTIVAMVDADMVFVKEYVREVLVPRLESLAATADPALGTEFGYTVNGMRFQNWKLPHRFNVSNVEALQSMGAPIFLSKRRWLQILPRYYSITREISQDAALMGLVHDGTGPSPWIAEMYGYTLATAGFRHEVVAGSASPPSEPGDRPFLVHYLHTFHLCGKKFGKGLYVQDDLLDCALDPSVLERLRPPPEEAVAADSCGVCIESGEVIGQPKSCFDPANKKWSLYAWQRVYNAVRSWHSSECAHSQRKK